MQFADILASLFPDGHDIKAVHGIISGSGLLREIGQAQVIGVAEKSPLGIDEAIILSRKVLAIIESGGKTPILVLIDSDSQRMSKRDELLGLNEYLAHLAKCLIYAGIQGHPTIGLLYGHSAAGAFIATALATRYLVALPGAEPEVMDLPSMSRVTKLSVEVLQEKAKSTPVFAPGLDNLVKMGAVLETWDERLSLNQQLRDLLAKAEPSGDTRGELGHSRNGRIKAASIAERVHDLALQRA